MATTTSPDQTVDFEHFIDYQLTRAQGRIKSVELGAAIVRLVAAAIVFVLAVIVLDYAIVLPSPIRLALLLVSLAAAAGYLAVRVIVPGVRRLNSFYAARTIERATPEFQNSLINFLDLRRRPKEISAGVLAALEERAVNDLSQVQVDDKINQDTLVRASYALAGVVLVACVGVLFNELVLHRSLADSLGRVLLPTADIRPPTNTRLTNVKPGDDANLNSIVAHSDVTVSVMADGKEPDAVTLFWSNDSGKFWHEQKLDHQGGTSYEPWKTVLVLVEKPFDYYLAGGDCRTKTFHMNVSQAPAVSEIEATYDYPEYTGWSRYTSRDGNIDALEGTFVTLVATTNRAARSGQIKFGPTKSPGPAMSLVPGRDDQLTTRFPVTRDDTYTIWFETDRGETNPRPATYSIKVRVDMPPTVQVKPGADLVEPPVALNAIVPIGVTARDDFGVEQVTLHVTQGQEPLKTYELTDGQSAGKEFTGTHRLDLGELRLAAGDEISYWIDVADNRQPTRHHATSPRYRIRLGSPLSAEDRQTELARSDEAEKAAAKAAEQPGDEPPDRNQPNQAGETAESGRQGQTTEEMTETPKDERAVDVIRKFMEEKDRERQTEQAREAGERGGQDSRPEQDPSKDQSGVAKPDSRGAGENSKPDGEKSDGEKQTRDKPADDRSDGEKSGEKSAGDKNGGDKPGSEKTAGEKPGGDKQAGDKPDAEKPDASKTGDEKSDPGKSGSDKSQPGKSGDNAAGDQSNGDQKSDKPGGDKPGGEKPGDKTDGQKSSGDKPGSEKAPGDKPRDGNSNTERPGGDKSDGSKTDGEKSGGDKPGDEKPKGDKAGNEPGSQKSSGEKPKGDESAGDKAGGDKAPADKAPNDSSEKMTGTGATGKKKIGDDPNAPQSGDSAGDKPGGDKPPNDKSGDKSSGDKPGGDKPSGDQQKGGDKPRNEPGGKDAATGDKPDAGSAPGEKPGGEKPGGDKSSANERSGEKPGDKSGGEKSAEKPGGKDAAGQKSGEDSSGQKPGDSEPGGDKKSGDPAGGDKSGGEKPGGEKSGGEKSGDKSSGQSGDSKQGGEKSGKPSGGDEKKGSQGASGKSPGQGAAPSKGSSNSGGGSNASAGQTPQPQPGGGPGDKKGPVQDNDGGQTSRPQGSGSNANYAGEGSDLVLQRVSDQLEKGDVDPELLRRLGWTQDELEQFVKDFSGPGKTDGKLPPGESPPKSKKPTEPGKTTLKDQRVGSTKRSAGQTAVDNLGDNLEGNRAKAPPEYEDLVRAYNMSQSKSEKPTSSPSGAKGR